MTKKYVKPMGVKEAEILEEAAEDVTHLIEQGDTPTAAIVKVASAAELTKHQTNLLIYAYTNGMAAEKRAEAGGPFERLGEYPLPDVKEVHRLVFGEPEEKVAMYNGLFNDPNPAIKTASASNILPYGMQTFDVDISQLDKEVVRELFGFRAKTAAERDEEEGHKPHCISMTRMTISCGKLPCDDDDCEDTKDDDGYYHKMPTCIEDMMERGLKPIAPDILNEFMSTLTSKVNEKRGEMISANSLANEAYIIANAKAAQFAAKLNHSAIPVETKAAGLASVKAFYPDIADIIAPTATEVNGYLIKAAGLDNPLAISAKHPWVAEARDVQLQLEKAASLTITAQQKAAEYKATWELYTKQLKKPQQKNAGTLGGFAMGALMRGLESQANTTTSEDVEKETRRQRENLLAELDDRLSNVQRDDVGVLSNINDFAVNDEILKAYPKEELLNKYTELLRVSPSAMRRKATARAMLQQQMTQGRFAPTELLPALQINKLDPHKSSLKDFRDENTDDARTV
jgi:hypothetical protein